MRPHRNMLAHRHVFVSIVGLVVAILLVLPTLVIIPVSLTSRSSFSFPPEGLSLQWYRNFFTDASWVESLLTSLKIATLVAGLSTVLGTMAAIGLLRWRRPAGANAIRAALLAPMVIPGIILGIGIYAVFAELHLLGSTVGFVIAHTVVALPLVVIPVTASLAGVDPALERAAENLGASPWSVRRHITLPLILPGILTGALFAFVTSFDEVLISLFIKSPSLETLPVKMYASVVDENDPTMTAAATVVIVLTVFVLGLSALAARSRRHLQMKGRA